MSNIHLHLQSFNAGELSPLLGNRFGVEKVASGCRKLRNFYCHIHGPAFRRPGMEYMGAAASDDEKSRLEGFNFSTTTGFILEFNSTGLRVWSNGVEVPLITPVALPYDEAACMALQMVQVNDVCYLAHPDHAPRKLVRMADDDWRLLDIDWTWPALGDETVRAENIATPAATEVLSIGTHTWPEYTLPAGAFSFSLTTPDTTGATKIAELQYLNSAGNWVVAKNFTWTTVAPSAWAHNFGAAKVIRLTYSGPLAAGGPAINQGLPGIFTLTTGIAHPQDIEPVDMPAGEWQALVDAPSTVPADAELWVQWKPAGTWLDYKRLTITADEITQYRAPALKKETELRFDWRGTRAMAGGTASLEKLEYPLSDDITIEIDTVSGDDRTLTASEPIFQAGHVGGFWQLVHRRDTAFVQIVSAVTVISAETSAALRVSGTWTVTTYGIWTANLFLEKKIQGSWEVMRSWSGRGDRNVIASGTESDEVEMRLRISAGTSEAATLAAVPRFVLEADNARAYGLVKITAVGTLDAEGKSDEATVDVISEVYSTDATPIWTEGAWSDVKGYPRTVALHGQRLWFGGTVAEPQAVWGSVVADYENFRRSSLDDASVKFTPAAQQSNAIQWMATHGDELVIGTTGNEWTLSPANGGVGIVTPVSAEMKRRSNYGSEYQAPLGLGDGLVFVQRGAQKLRQVGAHTDSIAWSASNLTVLADHATRAGVTQMAAMTFPHTILWAVTTDGKLLGMTFETEQNVFAWHVHETDGTVESVAVVHGSDTDEVWLVVLRDDVRSIERLDAAVFAQAFDAPARLIYLDAAVRVESEEPIEEVTEGLDHLEGKIVSVLADGADMGEQVVTGGAVTLEVEASTVIIGLPFTSELQPMRVEIPFKDGTAQGRRFKLSKVALMVHDSLGGTMADGEDGRVENLNYRRVSDALDSPPALHTGYIESSVSGKTREGVDVLIRTDGPHPLNVGGMVLNLDVFDE